MHVIQSPAMSASEVPDDPFPSAKVPPRLRIVHLEDDDLDAAVVLRELQRAGIVCDVIRVSTGAAYEQALTSSPPDLILSNNRIRGCDGLVALHRARDRAPGVP